MYKKSRIRIIAVIMSLLTVLWIATLAIIYFTTYREMATENREMMQLYAKAYAENGMPDHDEIINGRRFQVSTFYSVAFRENETEVTNDKPSTFTDKELVDLATAIKGKNKTFGVRDNIIFLVSEEESYTLVTLMDNTMIGETMELLVHYMIIFGGISVIVLIGLSYLFSNWIIAPLEENDKRQKRFVSDAGHELKTPISTVNANMEILERQIGENIWLENIKYENNRMETIVKQLLDLARVEDAPMEFTDVNMSRIVLAGVLPFEAKAFEKGVQLEYDVADNIHLTGNAYQMQMLVSTLIDNAFTHLVKRGNIHIKLMETHNGMLLTVSNQGEEIPEEERERIFDRFYRSDTTRNGEDNHYGLGLAIAKSIVQAHKGKIYVTCSDGWTTFNIEFAKGKAQKGSVFRNGT